MPGLKCTSCPLFYLPVPGLLLLKVVVRIKDNAYKILGTKIDVLSLSKKRCLLLPELLGVWAPAGEQRGMAERLHMLHFPGN